MTYRVLIGVTGGIAAYKICEVVSSLAKRSEFEVRVILTQSAEAFVTPLTFATLSRYPAFTDADFWQPIHGKPLHISLAEWADVFAIAPLSANTLGKLAYGMADNLLTNTVLASHCPILLAPAMNTTMWLQPSVQQNWQKLQTNPRFLAITPNSGILACDAVGMGRMAEPKEIISYIESLAWTKGKQDLVGKHLLVSAGGTREFLDPVRFIGNPSTGKQGMAIATAAGHRGAEVTLVQAGVQSESIANSEFLPNQFLFEDNLSESVAIERLDNPFTFSDREVTDAHPNLSNKLKIINVTTAAEMHRAMLQEFSRADITIMAAAVGDVRPATYTSHKIPKAELPMVLPLRTVRDILMDLSVCKRDNQTLVGFAAQTGTEAEIMQLAKKKLQDKGLDAIVANAIDNKQTGFATETNQAIFLNNEGEQATTPLCSKLELAHRLLDFLKK